MTHEARLDRLRSVAEYLPFAVDDYDAVNDVFARWTDSRADAHRRVIDIWIYCYVQRYVLLRVVRDQHLGAGEADRVIDYVFTRIHAHLDRVEDPTRFSHWASVVCKNSFLNGMRRRFAPTVLEESELAPVEAEPDVAFLAAHDRALVQHSVRKAIERLPPALRRIAELRLLEGRSYKHIAAVTDHPLPTVRTYAAKAIYRLRGDPALRILAQSLDWVAEELDPEE